MLQEVSIFYALILWLLIIVRVECDDVMQEFTGNISIWEIVSIKLQNDLNFGLIQKGPGIRDEFLWIGL